MSPSNPQTAAGSVVRMHFDGQPAITISQKQAAAAALAFLLITPLGRLVAAGVLGAIGVSGLIGWLIGTSA